jgi:Arc/MetJ family transcription regulator
MANLTITIDDELLKRARLRALERNTSVNALLREYLEAFAGERSGATARKRFAAIARAASSSSGGKGRSWSRDDLHDR